VNLRFLFLGTGTSAGIPAIACDCAVCASDDPRDTRLRTAAAVCWTDPTGQERTVLLDAGPDLRQQSLRHGLNRCDAILLTHNHVDHTWGLDEVRRFNAVMREPIDVWADARTHEGIRRVYQHVFDRALNVNDSFVAHLVPRVIDPKAPIDIHGLRFTPIPLLHGKLPVLGFRIEPTPAPRPSGERSRGEAERVRGQVGPLPLAYCTDVSGIPTESWRLLTDLDTLVLDALRFRKHPTHFTIGQAESVARQVGARQTWFIHLSHDVAHAAADADLPEGINLAHDGLVLSQATGNGQQATGRTSP
jgi:phosphoribosyl 1,2-cyclic phosphate phosphodiesterase